MHRISFKKKSDRITHYLTVSISLLATPTLLFLSTSLPLFLNNQIDLNYQLSVLTPFAYLFLSTLGIGFCCLYAARRRISRWRKRFIESRLDGFHDERRRGAPLTTSDQKIDEVVQLTLEETPTESTHWSVCLMAKRVGLPLAAIHRIWQAFSLQPHRVDHFRLSNNPHFVDKVVDIVGLYMASPAHAVVLCVDEKSQIQALENDQLILPMQHGSPC